MSHEIHANYDAKEGFFYLQQLNPLNIAPGVDGQYITAAELSSVQDDDPEILEREKPDHQFYLSYDFNPIDNLKFHGPHIPIRTGNWSFHVPAYESDLIFPVIFRQCERASNCTHPS